MNARVIALLSGAALVIAAAVVYRVKASAPGFQNIKNGLTQDEVQKILGMPRKEVASWHTGGRGSWLYAKESACGPLVFGLRLTTVIFDSGLVVEKTEDFHRNIRWDWNRMWSPKRTESSGDAE